MNDLDRRMRSGPRRSVLTLMHAGTHWVAGLHVFCEMYAPDDYGHANKFEKLAEQAAARGESISAAVYREEFERSYLAQGELR